MNGSLPNKLESIERVTGWAKEELEALKRCRKASRGGTPSSMDFDRMILIQQSIISQLSALTKALQNTHQDYVK